MEYLIYILLEIVNVFMCYVHIIYIIILRPWNEVNTSTEYQQILNKTFNEIPY